ncbi:EAL and HDOD domain-containing protein [Kineococcus rhizosphaerae]|uniref:EAL and modified HD-GYP domain-containing signal transduction protein n=1 Tax=Kineococcus rhizosphaerae TaxID=559628 RepID=A0A2T0R5S0_9ACTN|nr:HDOD domain-containing protein [Kineococcus rhizosphaerae]PRY16065.1 EAL and modified HD-GYP domain-containing signal transduction protein [Kineococcus rhizosphaerae]
MSGQRVVEAAPVRGGGAHADAGDGAGSAVDAAWVGLQAICTGQGEVYGYELLHRTGAANRTWLVGENEQERATAQVIAATFGAFGTEELAAGRRLFLNLTRSFVTGQLPLPFSPEGVVLELLETVDVDRRVLQGLEALKQRGFALALDDFDGEEWRIPAVALVDYVKIDVQVSGDRLPEVVALVRRVNPAAVVVAERVETQEQFQVCRRLGIELFQGYLLHRPDVLAQPVLSASHLTCVRLIASLSDREVALSRVVDLLSADPGLSTRILKTVSSAAYAPAGGITSLHQAVVMLGPRELRHWAVLVLLAGPGSVQVPEQTLTWIFARAEACRLLTPTDPEAASTVGLLSAAAQALRFDVSRITEGCALQPAIRQALLDGAGPLGAVLEAVRRHEGALHERTAVEPGTSRPGAARPAGLRGPALPTATGTGSGGVPVPAFPGALRPAAVSAAYLRAHVAAAAKVAALNGRAVQP